MSNFSFASDDDASTASTNGSTGPKAAPTPDADSNVASGDASQDPFAVDFGFDDEAESVEEEEPVGPVVDTGSWMDDDEEDVVVVTPTAESTTASAPAAEPTAEPAAEPAAEAETEDFAFDLGEFDLGDGTTSEAASASETAIASESAPATDTLSFGIEDLGLSDATAETNAEADVETDVETSVSSASGNIFGEAALEETPFGGAAFTPETPDVVAQPVAAPTETVAAPPINYVASARPRVAVLGASGIGKNHARWVNHLGGEVVSFLGSSDATLENTHASLSESFGFEGQSFTDVDALLHESRPEIVIVATPPELHYEQTRAALEAGCHVLCEKPLVANASLSDEDNRTQADGLVRLARENGLLLATQLQYAAAAPILCKLIGIAPDSVSDCAVEIETTNPKSPHDARALWLDLGAHALSVVQMLAGPQAALAPEFSRWESRQDGETLEVVARYAVRAQSGRLVTARAVTRRFNAQEEGRSPRRRFSFNGRVVAYAGIAARNGVYEAEYSSPDGYLSHYRDPVDYLISNFLSACRGETELVVDGAFGAQNLDWLLAISE